MSSLFNGERKMVYSFIDHCTQAFLRARNGEQEIETRYVLCVHVCVCAMIGVVCLTFVVCSAE
jgi:hypothetical protein